MKQSMKGVAKRLTFSLLVVSALGGCAVYEPANPGPYAYGTYATGQPVYVAPPVYADPYLYPYPYYYDPWYIGPPVSFNFGFSSWSGHRSHDRRFRGGHGGFRGSHGGGSGRGDR